MTKSAAHLYVSGYVQGVAFRYSARRKAQHLGLSGWVRNLPDGRVELLIEGEKQAVDQMTDWCWQGPPSAHVSDVQSTPQSYSGQFSTFNIAF